MLLLFNLLDLEDKLDLSMDFDFDGLYIKLNKLRKADGEVININKYLIIPDNILNDLPKILQNSDAWNVESVESYVNLPITNLSYGPEDKKNTIKFQISDHSIFNNTIIQFRQSEIPNIPNFELCFMSSREIIHNEPYSYYIYLPSERFNRSYNL